MVVKGQERPVVTNFDARAVEFAIIGAQESRRVPVAVNAKPAPAKHTAGIELVSVAEGATAARTDALEPCAGGEAGRGRSAAPRGHNR